MTSDVSDKSISFEAVKTSLSQTSTGMILRLAIHPNDLPIPLMTAWVGTRFAVAMVQIGDDDQPTATEGQELATRAIKSCGLLCRHKEFHDFLQTCNLIRATTATDDKSRNDECVKAIRSYLGIKSRSEMKSDKDALDKFIQLRSEFHWWYKNNIK